MSNEIHGFLIVMIYDIFREISLFMKPRVDKKEKRVSNSSIPAGKHCLQRKSTPAYVFNTRQ